MTHSCQIGHANHQNESYAGSLIANARLLLLGMALIIPAPAIGTSVTMSPPAVARLISANTTYLGGSAVFRAGLDITLAPGWKMYWRYPGDSGVSPTFDFTHSINVKDVHVLWPTPKLAKIFGDNLIVYEGRVTLPLHVRTADPDQGARLRLRLSYGVCETVCVPMDADLHVDLPPAVADGEQDVAAAERKVPKPAAVGDKAALSIKSIARVIGTSPVRINVEIEALRDRIVYLLVEGPSSDWSLPVPEEFRGPVGKRVFSYELAGAPAGADALNARLRYTLTDGVDAIEVVASVNEAAAK